MGCQNDIAQKVVDQGADYVLALKENQGQLYEDVRDLFEGAEEFGFEGVPYDYTTTLNKGHGRIERRPFESGIPEHRPAMAQPALGGQSDRSPRDVQRDHSPTQVLHQQPECPGEAPVGGGTRPLEYRELVTLEPGCDLRGRPMSGTKGPRTAKHGDAAADFP